jgi:hypothetical protein
LLGGWLRFRLLQSFQWLANAKCLIGKESGRTSALTNKQPRNQRLAGNIKIGIATPTFHVRPVVGEGRRRVLASPASRNNAPAGLPAALAGFAVAVGPGEADRMIYFAPSRSTGSGLRRTITDGLAPWRSLAV